MSANQSYSYIPQVVVEHLHPNLKLLDDPTIERIKTQLSGKRYGRYGKSMLGIPYGIYYGEEGLFAIFNKNHLFYRLFYQYGNQFRLGDGTFGYVKLAQNIETGEWKAMKVMAIRYPLAKQQFFQECSALNKLNQTQDANGMVRISRKHNAIEKGSVIMALATGCELYECLDRRLDAYPKDDIAESSWPELIWLDIAIKIAIAIKKEVHDKNLLHIDIKMENFMWDLARQKITPVDFGSSKECQIDRYGNKYVSYKQPHGTLDYIAPELFPKNHLKKRIYAYTEQTEVYALGILFKQILFNCFINQGMTTQFSETILEHDEALGIGELTNSMTHASPSKRPTMDNIIKQLYHIRNTYISYYPDDLKISQAIYKKAEKKEQQRLEEIHTRLLKSENSHVRVARL